MEHIFLSFIVIIDNGMDFRLSSLHFLANRQNGKNVLP